MSSRPFRFKQFVIHQDRCAMKVGTDGVALGAWVPLGGARRILDIGTGTGLIALMLAQRSAEACHIDGVELDPAAASQAAENVMSSPWPDKVTIHTGPIQHYHATMPYDLIVSNPPFFRHGQAFANTSRQQARHTSTLGHQELLQHATRLLTPEGELAVILPIDEAEQFQCWSAQHGWNLALGQRLIPRPGKEPNRFLMLMSRNKNRHIGEDVVICADNGRYSDIYSRYVAPFYLAL